MRKICLLFIFISLTCGNCLLAQSKFGGGIFIGTSITSLSDVDYLAEMLTDTLTETIGKDFPVSKAPRGMLLNAGAFISYELSPKIELRGGIEYAPKGEKFNGECYLSTSMNMVSQVLVLQEKIKLAYIEFPISAQFSTKSKENPEKLYYFASFGAAPAINVLSEVHVSLQHVERGFDAAGSTEKFIDSEISIQKLDFLNGSDLCMFGTLGLVWDHLLLEFKLDQGMQNIENADGGHDIKNSLYALRLGYKF